MPKSEFKQPVDVHRIVRLERSPSTELRVLINEFDDKLQLDARRFYKTAKMEKFAPTAKGITFSGDDVPELLQKVTAFRKALQKAERKLMELENDK